MLATQERSGLCRLQGRYHRSDQIFSPKKVLPMVGFLFAVIFTSISQAAPLEREKLAAVMSIISMYLMDERERAIDEPDGRRIDFDLNQLSDQTYQVSSSQSLYAAFDLQDVGIEYCFYLQTSGSIAGGDVTLEINGNAFNAYAGENCFKVPQGQQRNINYANLIVNKSGLTVSLSQLELQSVNQSQLRLPRLTRGEWNQAAVRKVLKIFAFGGQASDQQIATWANMRPSVAIQEMLNFSEHNLKLSPFVANEQYRDTRNIPGTLDGFSNFLSSDASNLPIPTGEFRAVYSQDMYRFEEGFNRMVVARGLNPFRQRIGFWETNYHLAVNLDTQVEQDQLVVYYDTIMEAHEAGLPYKDVMGLAAKSAAIATQYGHRFNEWDENNKECKCNDDYAREIHQLFYGIFGVDDPNHEDGTIRETAKMLTDMKVRYVNNQGLPNYVTFGTNDHHVGDLTILGRTVSGADASAKIDNLMPISIQHPESLQNLPIMIISTLADDKLSESSRQQLRRSWASMGVNRKLLDFIHAYAISELFHSNSHFKFLTTFERAFYVANKYNINNIEAFYSNRYRVGREIDGVFTDDNSNKIFHPLHNVFGAQTSIEASDSAVAFEKNYNRATPVENWQFRQEMRVECDDCNAGGTWQKDWTQVIPRPGGGYTADYVARWLWVHVMGSTLEYSALERGHLLAILGANRVHNNQPWDRFQYMDINYLLCIRADRISKGQNDNSLSTLMSRPVWERYCRHGDDGNSDYSSLEKQAFNQTLSGDAMSNTPHIKSLIDQLAVSPLPLESLNAEEKRRANERVHAALAFIFATPFVFGEGR